MVTIHHLSYPHIIDAIWAGLDLSSMLSARQTCSDWRKRANKLLHRHMVAKPHGEGLMLYLKHPHSHRLPRYFVHPEVLYDISKDPSLCDYADAKLLGEVFRNIKALDTTISRHDPEEVLCVLEQLSLQTVLRTNILTRGEFAILYGQGNTQIYFLDLASNLGLQTPGVKTLVLYVDCFSRRVSPLCHPYDVWSVLDFENIAGCELVFVFTHAFKVRSFRPAYAETLVGTLGGCWGDADVTLVGVDEFFHEAEAYAAFKKCFHRLTLYGHGEADELSSDDGRYTNEEDAPEGPVKLLTRAEYERLIGREKYKLHTVW